MVLMVVGIPNQPPGSGAEDPLDAEPQEDWVNHDPKTPEEVWRVITGIAEGEGDDVDEEIAAMAVDILSHFGEPDPVVDDDASTVSD